MLKSLFIILLSVLFSTPLFSQKNAPPPAGLDSLTKSEADSIAKQLFGEEKAETRALREFEKGKEDFQSGEAFLAEADSMRRSGEDTTLKKPGGVIGTLRQAFGDTTMSSRERETRKRADAVFRRAAREFENAIKYSPELKEVPLWLVATYDRLKEWRKSVELYREILNERQGEDRLWFNYGYAALQAGEHPIAVNAFEQAIHISVLVSGDSAAVPNRYCTFAGEAFLRTYQDRLALARFRQAQQHAAPADSAEIQRTIEWILWDEGGIATAEYRDAAYRAEAEQRWDDARKAYLGGLHSARTEKAKDELSYRLALLEFQHGTRTDGLSRMKELMATKPNASAEWRENYGKMLFAYAQILEKEGDKRGALSYFLQATKIVWSAQGAGYVEIARIAANDLDSAIEHAAKALDYPLTREQRLAAYQILESAYRSKGNWEMMREYRQLMEETP
ncbi:hypothetical protein KKH27_02415 [bacterium]|nr:hypothetical protein [bacterium]MBU1984667.1 hypothetical protein [bacterium]